MRRWKCGKCRRVQREEDHRLIRMTRHQSKRRSGRGGNLKAQVPPTVGLGSMSREHRLALSPLVWSNEIAPLGELHEGHNHFVALPVEDIIAHTHANASKVQRAGEGTQFATARPRLKRLHVPNGIFQHFEEMRLLFLIAVLPPLLLSAWHCNLWGLRNKENKQVLEPKHLRSYLYHVGE